MKKISILSIVLFVALSCPQSFAQSFFGARAGINLAQFGYQFESNDDEKEARDGTSLHPVIQGGIFFRKQINHFAFQPELCWVQKGVSMKDHYGDYIEIVNITVNYLETPLLLKAMFGSDSKKFSVFAGPAFSFAVGGHIKGIEIIAGDRTSEKIKIDFKDAEFNRFEVSVVAGIGGTFKVGKGFIDTDVRYMYGLSKLNDDDSKDKYFNRGIAISVGYILMLH